MKGTGALSLGGRITVVSTGDLLSFLYNGGVNVYLSLSRVYNVTEPVRDEGCNESLLN